VLPVTVAPRDSVPMQLSLAPSASKYGPHGLGVVRVGAGDKSLPQAALSSCKSTRRSLAGLCCRCNGNVRQPSSDTAPPHCCFGGLEFAIIFLFPPNSFRTIVEWAVHPPSADAPRRSLTRRRCNAMRVAINRQHGNNLFQTEAGEEAESGPYAEGS